MKKSIDEISKQHLCHRCIGEEFFSSEVKAKGYASACDYCQKRKKGLPLDQISDRIEEILERHYQPAAMEPNWLQIQMLKDRES
jgi:hypothetical protein